MIEGKKRGENFLGSSQIGLVMHKFYDTHKLSFVNLSRCIKAFVTTGVNKALVSSANGHLTPLWGHTLANRLVVSKSKELPFRYRSRFFEKQADSIQSVS
jgi:hypothetical protein